MAFGLRRDKIEKKEEKAIKEDLLSYDRLRLTMSGGWLMKFKKGTVVDSLLVASSNSATTASAFLVDGSSHVKGISTLWMYKYNGYLKKEDDKPWVEENPKDGHSLPHVIGLECQIGG